MNSKTLFHELVNGISLPEEADEIQHMVLLALDKLVGVTQTDVLANKSLNLLPEQKTKLQEVIARINKHEPIQYILQEADFYGRKFLVNSSVLIPRPETEELVKIVLDEIHSNSQITQVLDIGTGSGCIPVTIKLAAPHVNVFATDVSDEALAVARNNSNALHADVQFLHHDILNSQIPVTNLDILISNPPYIAPHEKETMKQNVVEFEPHLALFVSDDDPLIFYKKIARQGKMVLKSGGKIFVEINERSGVAVKNIFMEHNYSTEIIQDINGKDRIVKAIK